MRNTKHTPGPWVVAPTPETIAGGDFQARILTTGGKAGTNVDPQSEYIIVGNHVNKNGHGNIMHEANAKLIAAAPDLLEALQDMMKQYRKVYGFADMPWEDYRGSVVTKCESAIKKATE